MKRIYLILLAAFLLPPSVCADDYLYMVFSHSDDTAEGFELRKTQCITFGDNEMVVKTTDGTTSIVLNTLSSLDFTGTLPTAVETVQRTWEAQNISVYNISGMLVKQWNSTDYRNENLILQDLPAGIYIVKNGTQTRKWLKR